MTIDSQPKFNTLLQKIGTLLIGSAETSASQTEARPKHTQPNAMGVDITPPFAVITSFEDYAAEGEEPADLALLDLIPAELAELNLPYCQSRAGATDASEQAFGLCLDRPLTEAEKIAAEMTDFIPIGLSSLNIPFPLLAPAKTSGEAVAPESALPEATPSPALSHAASQLSDLRQSRRLISVSPSKGQVDEPPKGAVPQTLRYRQV